MPPGNLPAISGALCPNRDLFVKLVHKSALFRFNYRVCLSAFSYMLSSMASHRCTLRTKFLLMDGSACIRD